VRAAPVTSALKVTDLPFVTHFAAASECLHNLLLNSDGTGNARRLFGKSDVERSAVRCWW
jgi:hypothetical protein